MKKNYFLAPLLAAALMVSCAKDADLSPNPDQSNELEGAYISLNVIAPTTRIADGPDVAGTPEESAVTTVRLLIFDKEYNYLGKGESSTPVKGKDLTYQFEVAPDAYRFFVIVNPTSTIDDALRNISGNWNTVSSALQSVLLLDSRTDLDAYTTAGAFPMVNAGSYANNVETVLVRPIDSELMSNGKISTDKADASEIVVNVDRMVAKFTANVNEDLEIRDERTKKAENLGIPQVPAPTGSIDGVRLNVVNKKSYIYSHINQVNTFGDDYRSDPNMAVPNEEAKPQGQPTELTKNFFWLHNYESPTFNLPGESSTEYVFENTADGGEYFNYNNLTQLVVKATYLPTGQPDPDDLPTDMTTHLDHQKGDMKSWFAINIKGFGTMQMTFNGVKEYYAAITTGVPGHDKEPDTCAKMDTQLRHMLAFATNLGGIQDISTATWADAEVTCEVLNSIPNGGYVAATVENEEDYIVQFYQFAINYYDVFVQHDSAQDIGHLGRWGMVRNNHYTLTINSLKGPGFPYIPDPTDPDIKDPQNPDPKDPEPADKGMGYIDATIVVNKWTMWTQDVDLE